MTFMMRRRILPVVVVLLAAAGSGARAEVEDGMTVMGDSIAGVACSLDPAGITVTNGPPPTLGASWPALSQILVNGIAAGPRPPDPHAAVGPSGVLEVVNQRVAYFSKSGTVLWGPVFLYQWWTTFSASVFDPKVLYDASSQRFFVVLHENRADGTASYVNIAVSKSSHPMSSGSADWYLIGNLDITEIVGAARYGADYPGIGVDGQALYVSYNMFPLGAHGIEEPYYNSQILIFRKSSLIAGVVDLRTRFTSPPGRASSFTLQPATVVGAAGPGNVAYFAETPREACDFVRIWAVTDPLGQATLQVPPCSVVVPNNGGENLNASLRARGADQCGAVLPRVTTLSPRTMAAVWCNGALWFVHTAGGAVPNDDHTLGRSIVYYYKVLTNGYPAATPVLAESGGIDAGPGIWNYMPAIGANALGDLCITFTQSSYSHSECPTMMVTTRPAGATKFSLPIAVKTSPVLSEGRWGDYASVAADPTDNSFWVCGEWATTAIELDWGTWVANVKIDCSVCNTAAADPRLCGQWSVVADNSWPAGLAPSHMILTRTGKVLMWDNTNSSTARAHYWDPTSLVDLPVSLTATDTTLRKAAHVVMGDGRILVFGGQYVPPAPPANDPVGVSTAYIFDPGAACAPSCSWERVPSIGVPRALSTGVALPDARVLAVSGWQHRNLLASTPELLTVSGRVTLNTAQKGNMSLTPFMYVDPTPGAATAVVYLGPGSGQDAVEPPFGILQPAEKLSNLSGSNPTWSSIGSYSVRGAAFAPIDWGRVLKSGGVKAGGSTITSDTEEIAIDPSGVMQASMDFAMCTARTEHQLVVLVDGSVLAVGGSSTNTAPTDACEDGVLTAEVWHGSNAGWLSAAPMVHRVPSVPRMYQSTGVLLPDGRVLVAGGQCQQGLVQPCPGSATSSCTSADFYSPPYLFKADGTAINSSERPSVNGTKPLSVVYGEALTFSRSVGAGATAIERAALVRPGATTHSTDMDQRYIPFCVSPCISGGAPPIIDGPSTITIPAASMPSNHAAPPGYYMLFLRNNLGRPSIGHFIVLWEVVDASVTKTGPVVHEDGTFDIDFTWRTSADAVDGDVVTIAAPPGGNPTGTVSHGISSDGLTHTWHFHGYCWGGTWSYQVQSRRPKYGLGDGLSVSSSTAKTFKISACLN